MTPEWPSNPFSTRFLAPGKCRFVGLDEQTLNGLAEKLIQQNGNGQIVGPHGTGKTTLTFELQKRMAELSDTGDNYRFVRKTIGPGPCGNCHAIAIFRFHPIALTNCISKTTTTFAKR